MRNARRTLFTMLVLGLMAISTVATAIPASASSQAPTPSVRPLGVIYR